MEKYKGQIIISVVLIILLIGGIFFYSNRSVPKESEIKIYSSKNALESGTENISLSTGAYKYYLIPNLKSEKISVKLSSKDDPEKVYQNINNINFLGKDNMKFEIPNSLPKGKYVISMYDNLTDKEQLNLDIKLKDLMNKALDSIEFEILD